MLPGDAYLWTRNRHDLALQDAYKKLTDNAFDKKNGIFGRIGNHTIIKNTRSIKDALIGSNAYIKGANKIKNVTIHSGLEGHTQIGEGCEIVNGIVGFGCRIFYGVKAVRFILGDHAQLKYGARLINSYLGFNSTISCCEVLNALIFPNHEQHHNNSFLCSALLMGQSNLAAGATIGSIITAEQQMVNWKLEEVSGLAFVLALSIHLNFQAIVFWLKETIQPN